MVCIFEILFEKVYTWLGMFITFSVYRGDTVDEDNQRSLVQQLKLELSHKNMIFPKKCIHLSKVVGQGMFWKIICYEVLYTDNCLCFTGESGVVYCGYLESGGGRDMVAVKTCKGMKYWLIMYVLVYIFLIYANLSSVIHEW